MDKQTEKALSKLLHLEEKMKARLRDNTEIKAIFSDSLSNLRTRIRKRIPVSNPQGFLAGGQCLDSLQGSLKFLDQHKELLGQAADKLSGTLHSVQQLQGRFENAQQIKDYIRKRQEFLKQKLSGLTGMDKYLSRYNKEAYYYGARVREYQAFLQNRKKAEAKAIELLKQLSVYKDFMKRNSQLAGLFNLSANYHNIRSIEGLQTRSMIESAIQQRIGSNPVVRQAISQQMDAAREKFNELKKKFPELDNTAEMPDFKPNEMKTKPIWQRLEWGGNIQFQKTTYYFPTTSDFAGQVAYKFHKNGSAGIGLSYKLGMGRDWSHIRLTHRGIGLRSFMDWRLMQKGSFFLAGGYEINRLTTNTTTATLANWNGWQASALLGVSKKYKVSPKLKCNLMVLYDFLAPRQLPKTDNIKVRIGYTL